MVLIDTKVDKTARQFLAVIDVINPAMRESNPRCFADSVSLTELMTSGLLT